MTLGTAQPMIRLDITPLRVPMDAEITVRILDAPRGGQVTVLARSTDAAGQAWQSAATFIADDSGTVDLRRDPPLPGSSYAGTDPMGLVWSMRPAGPPDPRAARERLAPQRLLVVAQADGTSPAAAEVSRQLVPDGLTRTEVSERGLVGVLYRPAGHRPLPAVLMLGAPRAACPRMPPRCWRHTATSFSRSRTTGCPACRRHSRTSRWSTSELP